MDYANIYVERIRSLYETRIGHDEQCEAVDTGQHHARTYQKSAGQNTAQNCTGI